MKNRIEEIRKARGIRQEDFAKEMGVSRQTISSLENGRYNPSIMLAYKIAKYFGMTIEAVFIFDEEEQKQEILKRAHSVRSEKEIYTLVTNLANGGVQ